MINPKFAIPRIRRILLDATTPGNTIDQNAALAAVKCLINDLKSIATTNEMSHYTFSKFADLEWNVDIIFRLDEFLEHPLETHRMWATLALQTLADRECFGTFDY